MKRGFSLVELSIVLVILGLLTGGILAGQSLIHAAELRSVSTEYQRYVAATQAFRDKYFQLPGDMNNAAKFWGAADGAGEGNTVACFSTTTNDARTCNGNGNGRIGDGSNSDESLRFWQQLASAGLIEGQYSGIRGTPAANTIIMGTNVPRSKLGSSSYWFPQTEGTHTSFGGRIDSAVPYNNTLFFGGWTGTYRGNLKPEDAWNIDTKMDDGKPGQGKIKAPWDATYSASGTFCTNGTTSANAVNADYLLTNPNTDCEAFFTNAF